MKKNLLVYRFANPEKIKYKVYISLNPTDCEGDCGDPRPGKSKIRIRNTLMRTHRSRRQLSIILEEMLHAHDFSLTERVVRKYAANTMKLLYKLGWRWRADECLNIDNFRDRETWLAMLAWRRKKHAKRKRKRNK